MGGTEGGSENLTGLGPPALAPSSGGRNLGRDGDITDHSPASMESSGMLLASGGIDGFGGFGRSFIGEGVGRGQANKPEDVFQVSNLLAANGLLSGPTRRADEELLRGIEAGQQKLHELTNGSLRIDGIVKPQGPTEIVAQRAVTGGHLRMPEIPPGHASNLAPTTETAPKSSLSPAPAVAASTPGRSPGQQAATVRKLQAQSTPSGKPSGLPTRNLLTKRPDTMSGPHNLTKLADAVRSSATGQATPPDIDTSENRLPRAQGNKGLAPTERPKRFIDPMDGADGLPGDPVLRARALRTQADIAKHEQILKGFEEEVRKIAGEDEARAFRKKIEADRIESQKKLRREEAARKASMQRKKIQKDLGTDPTPFQNAETDKSFIDQVLEILGNIFDDVTDVPTDTPPLDPPDVGPPPPITNQPGPRSGQPRPSKQSTELNRFLLFLRKIGRRR